MLKLIVTDMDGTFFNNEQEISEYNLNAIRKAQEKGVRFMIATGRNNDTIGPIKEQYGFRCACLLMNGAEIRDEQENIISKKSLDKTDMIRSVNILREYDMYAEFMTNKGVYIAMTPDEAKYVMIDRMKCLRPDLSEDEIIALIPDTIYYKYLHFIDREEDLLDDAFEVYKMIAFHNNADVCTQVRKVLEKETKVCALSSYPTNVEINNKSAQKGIALKKAIQIMGIEPDEVAVFGDGLNDKTLFTEFKNSYAPENAIPEIKALAKEIIDYNYNNGVGKKIMELISS